MLVAAVGLALALSLPAIECPGLYYDEVLFADGWSDHRCAWCPAGVPLMTLGYLGALKTWLYWPFAGSLSVALVRLPWVGLAAVSLVWATLLAARLYGPRAAALAALMLAVDPTFLFYQRLDWGPVAIGTCLRTVSLLLLVHWREHRGDWRVPLTSALLGLGLYDKLTFGWHLLGLLVGLWITRRHWPIPRPRLVALSVLAVGAGALPLLAYNLAFPLASLRERPLLAAHASPRGALVDRLSLIGHVLTGDALYWNVNQRPLPCALPGSACFAMRGVRAVTPSAIAVALVLAVVWHGPGREWSTRLLLTLIATTGIALVGLARVGPHHVPTLLPFTHVLVAGVAVRLAARGRAWRVGVACVVALMLAGQLGTSLATTASFRATCGRGLWSAAVYDLAEHLARTPARSIYVADWGIAAQLRVLLPGADIHEVAWSLEEAPPARPAEDVLAEARERAGVIVLHDAATTRFATARRRVVAGLRALGVTPDAVRRVADREGTPVFEVVDAWSTHPGSP